MTLEEFKILAKGMKSVYTRENFLPDKESIKIWFTLLKDIPYEVLNVAIQKWMMTNKFAPTIADLRELSNEVTQGQISDWGDGWEQVLKAIRVYGSYNASAALDSMDDITRKCVERLGFREICMSENIAVDRANFRMLYETIANRQKEDGKLSLSIKTKLAQLSDQGERKLIE